MGDVRIREFREIDLPSTLELLKASLGETFVLKRTPDLFTWKHFENPFGRSLILVAESGGQIVGLRAFMRWTLMSPEGSEVRCVRAVDTATHPDFQRQGIFRRLTLAALEVARGSGIHLVFNTPNQSSRPGYLKMGWRDVGKIGVFVYPRLYRSGHSPQQPPTEPFIASSLDTDDQDSSWPRDREPLGLRTQRTGRYLNWRFTEHPTARYSIVNGRNGKLVFRSNVRRGRRELVVSDLLGPVTRLDLLRSALASRSQYVVGWFSRGSPERRKLLASGFIPLPGVHALRLVALPLQDLSVDVFDDRSWDISLGDLELL